jgi:cytochrome c oxidase subunit 3
MNEPVALRTEVAQPPISNARLATILVIVTELMLFVGLIAGYVILRYGSNDFAGMIHPEMGLTAISTPVLLLSSITLILAQRAYRTRTVSLFRKGSLITLALGLLFLVLQLIEWRNLMGEGIFPAGSVQSGMFYLLSGVHGLHVFGGLVLLSLLAWRSRPAAGAVGEGIVSAAGIYWHFVTLLWGALWVMIFLV